MKKVEKELDKINAQLELMRDYIDHLESLKDDIELLQEKTHDGTLFIKNKKELTPCIVKDVNYTRLAGFSKAKKFTSSVTVATSSIARKISFKDLVPYNHSTKVLFGEEK